MSRRTGEGTAYDRAEDEARGDAIREGDPRSLVEIDAEERGYTREDDR